MLLSDAPLPDEGLLDEPVGVVGAPLLPLVPVPPLLVEPLGDPLVPVPLVSLLPGVPGVTALSPSPAPVPLVPVWVGLVSIGGSAMGESAGFAGFPVEPPGVVVLPALLPELPLELGVGVGVLIGLVVPPTCVGALLPMPVPLALPALEPGVACAK